MSKSGFLASAGVTPAKLALIGVLAIVLIAVVVIQIPWSSPQATTGANDRQQRQPNRSPRNPPKPEDSNRKTESPVKPTTIRWPEIPLQSILAHDPFAAPAWTRNQSGMDSASGDRSTDANREGNASSNRQLLLDLHSAGVSLVMISRHDRVARIGEMELREGDRIGGLVVQEINTNGVVLVEPQAP